MKLNKNIIYYITEDLPTKTAFIINCQTNVIIKLDEIGVEYFLKIINAKDKSEISELLEYFEGCDFFE